MPALISGIFSGIGYQIFQTMYINGVIWISKYNAIYGSFAAFPLLLLWLQLSWTIVLYGAQLSYAIQNISSYAFGKTALHASRRYQDFVCLLILNRMLKRMDEGVRAYNIDEISAECKIPLRMSTSLINRMEDVGLLVSVRYSDDGEEIFYQPAYSAERLTISFVVSELDNYGPEDFRIDRRVRYKTVWQAMQSSRGLNQDIISPDTLIRDL